MEYTGSIYCAIQVEYTGSIYCVIQAEYTGSIYCVIQVEYRIIRTKINNFNFNFKIWLNYRIFRE